MSHDSIGEGKGGSRPIGKVTNHQTIWKKGWRGGEEDEERRKQRRKGDSSGIGRRWREGKMMKEAKKRKD